MDQSNFHVIVGRQVRLHRRAQGLSQKGLAALADVHSTYISNIERGEVSASLYCFYKIAQALGILLADLFCVLDPNCNSDFENEFAVVMSKIRHMDDVQRGLYLGAIKGMLPK